MNQILGWHWMLDASHANHDQLVNPEHMRAVLESLPKKLGLTLAKAPQVTEQAVGTHEHVVAGIVLISESHLSLHAQPHVRILHADLFSCKRFDAALALAVLQEAYVFRTFRQSLLERSGEITPCI